MNWVTTEKYLIGSEQPPNLGQVMNKVQKQRRISRGGVAQSRIRNQQSKNTNLPNLTSKMTWFQRFLFMLTTFQYLFATFTLLLPVWLFCLFCRIFNSGSWNEVYSQYTIAIIGSRSPMAIQLARHFRKMGYIVIGMESRQYMCAPLAWSRACNQFYWLPDPMEPPLGSGPEVYTETLWGLLLDLKPNFLIPLNRYTASEDQQVTDKVDGLIELLSMEPMEVLKLSDLHTFFTKAHDSNCNTPTYSAITERDQVKIHEREFENSPWVYRLYRANIWGAKMLANPNSSEEVNCIAQRVSSKTPLLKIEKMDGPVISICSLYTGRKAVAHSLSVRKGNHIVSMDDKKIIKSVVEWCDKFVERYHVDMEGWLSFDFMKSTEDHEWYPINCKPWVTESFALLFDESEPIIEALELDTRSREDCSPIFNPEERKVRCCGRDLITSVTRPYRLLTLFKLLLNFKDPDILFLKSDPFPFFATYLLDLPMQLWLMWRNSRRWERIDYFNNVIVTSDQLSLKVL